MISSDFRALASVADLEEQHLREAAGLFQSGFYPYALLALWNAAIVNLRRRVECYGSDLFASVIKDNQGRKRYRKDGETLSDRWEGVDDLVLIEGCAKLGLLLPKASKSLEMINWMRNHSTPAHPNENAVDQEDVLALALILQNNLFNQRLPDPGHSVHGLFGPIKSVLLNEDQIDTCKDQIAALRLQDLRICFGFMLDLLCEGQRPALDNVKGLFPAVWKRASEELKLTAGMKLHSLHLDKDSDDSADGRAEERLWDFLVSVGGVRYIPEARRAQLYRRAIGALRNAKDRQYGWRDEEAAARALAQLGPHVPNTAFEEVYQEILAVWCGNYWGRSEAWCLLEEFIWTLPRDQLLHISRMFITNGRVREELFQRRPRQRAIELLKDIKARVQAVAHQNEIDKAIDQVNSIG